MKVPFSNLFQNIEFNQHKDFLARLTGYELTRKAFKENKEFFQTAKKKCDRQNNWDVFEDVRKKAVDLELAWRPPETVSKGQSVLEVFFG